MAMVFTAAWNCDEGHSLGNPAAAMALVTAEEGVEKYVWNSALRSMLLAVMRLWVRWNRLS